MVAVTLFLLFRAVSVAILNLLASQKSFPCKQFGMGVSHMSSSALS